MKIKKYCLLGLVSMVAILTLTGCMPMNLSGAQPQPTETAVVYDSTDALAKAVEAQKSGDGEDNHGLAALDHYYGFHTLPQGAKIDSIKVLSFAVRVLYTFGPTTEDTYDNRMEMVWYRDTTGTEFISKVAQNATLTTLKQGDITYYRSVAKVKVAEDSDESMDYCQIVYWSQEDRAYMAAVPMGFSDEDIGTYCQAQQMSVQ